MSKVLLTTSPRPKHSPMHYADNRPPQGLGILYQVLTDRGHDVVVVDPYTFPGYDCCGVNKAKQEAPQSSYKADVFKTIEDFDPDYVGIYVTTLTFQTATYLARSIRREYGGIRLICGGPHPTLFPNDMLGTFDYVVCGEGERALVDIVEDKLRPKVVKYPRLKITQFNDLPWFDYSIFTDKPYNWGLDIFNCKDEPVFVLNTSRGCPFKCAFCSVHSVHPRFKDITAIRICERMEELSIKFGATTFYFREDNFTASQTRLGRFCDLMIARQYGFKWACESRVKELNFKILEKMAKAGCIGMYIGCESGSDIMLVNMNKAESVEDYKEKIPFIHNLGISVYTTWMYGLPGEARIDRRLTKALIEKLQPYMTAYDEFVYIGIPRSEIYDRLDKLKLYELKDASGIIYPHGYFSLARHLYGEDDSRVDYVRNLYKRMMITGDDTKW